MRNRAERLLARDPTAGLVEVEDKKEGAAGVPYEDDDQVSKAIYARMLERAESLTDAAAAMGVTTAQIARVQEHLTRLRLLDPDAEAPVDAAAMLRRSLEESHRLLDRLVEQHVAVAAVARSYLNLPGRAERDMDVDFFTRDEMATRLARRITELSEQAGHEILSMHPVADWTPASLAEGLERSERALARGVRVRALHAQSSFSQPVLRGFVDRWTRQGREVRAAPVVPTRMLVYDRHTAVVQADPAHLDAGALVIRGRGVVRSLAALYDNCWMTASEPKDVPGSSDAGALTEQQRAILRLLAVGAKDSAIARTLGISTRTVTRVVGEVSALLGATSRFQAGVRATRLGWLD
ncbi:LuxR C-terminal-related transcriptional regulator [Nonomuraea sp. NPDC051191]|uniref:helix-turn-helix transcriptional regulator n=1 Tax=Nonomuraea sp. NPDC051191 TaxID=3364372 RepID=UPI0037A6EAB7